MTVESIMRYIHTYSGADSKLILRESHVGKSQYASPLALVTMTSLPRQPWKCFCCGRAGHMVREFQRMNAVREEHDCQDEKKCFSCGKVRHIWNEFRQNDDKDDSGGGQVGNAMVTIAQTAVAIVASS